MKSEYLANLQMATTVHRPTRYVQRSKPQPLCRFGYVVSLAWSLVLLVGVRM